MTNFAAWNVTVPPPVVQLRCPRIPPQARARRIQLDLRKVREVGFDEFVEPRGLLGVAADLPSVVLVLSIAPLYATHFPGLDAVPDRSAIGRLADRARAISAKPAAHEVANTHPLLQVQRVVGRAHRRDFLFFTAGFLRVAACTTCLIAPSIASEAIS